MKSLVYRVETKNNQGPYSASAVAHCQWTPYSRRVRPGPGNDGLYEFTHHHYFGFADTKQLTKWFNKADRKSFKSRKFQVSVYEVADKYVLKGNRQVAFELEKAKLVKILDPLTLEVVYEKTNPRRKKALSEPRHSESSKTGPILYLPTS